MITFTECQISHFSKRNTTVFQDQTTAVREREGGREDTKQKKIYEVKNNIIMSNFRCLTSGYEKKNKKI